MWIFMLNELNISNSNLNLNLTALVIESGLLYGKGKHENASKCFLCIPQKVITAHRWAWCPNGNWNYNQQCLVFDKGTFIRDKGTL